MINVVTLRARARLTSPLAFILVLFAALLLMVQPAEAATFEVCASGCPYSTIQSAITAASSGDTVSVAPGTYDEPLTIYDKYITLIGAGSGDGPGDTILQGTIDVQSGGTSVANRQVIQNLRVASSIVGTSRGIALMGSHITLNNVTVIGKTEGVYIHLVSDLIVENSDFINNRYAFRVQNKASGPAHVGTLNGAVIRNSYFTGGDIALAAEQVTAETGQFNNVEVVDTRFEAINRKAIYIEMGNDILFNRVEIDRAGIVGNNEVPTAAIDINLKFQAYNNIEIRDSVITQSGALGTNPNFPTPSAIEIKTRDDGGSYGSNPASATNVQLTRVTVENNPYIGIRFGEPGKNNGGLTTPVITLSSIVNNGGEGLVNLSQANVMAENNWWGCNEGPDTPNCETTVNTGTGSIDANPWLVLTASSVPAAVNPGGNAVISGEITSNSDGLDAGGGAPDGTTVSFASLFGTLDNATATTVAGVASSTFTAGATIGVQVVNVTVDSATVATLDIVEGAVPPPDVGDDDTPAPPPQNNGPIQTYDSGEIGAGTGGAITASGNPSVTLTALVVNGAGNLAGVGDPTLISLGVVQAVDVFTYLPGGVLATVFDPPITVCLQGAGTVYFRPAADQTGTFSPVPAFSAGGTLCVTLSQPGLLVLVGTTTAPAASAPVANGGSTPLTDCQVTTDFLLRLRADASTSSDILTRLPMGTTLDATEMVDGWYRVIYGDVQGWVSADYVSTNGNCG